jgi:hypothetical protein
VKDQPASSTPRYILKTNASLSTPCVWRMSLAHFAKLFFLNFLMLGS